SGVTPVSPPQPPALFGPVDQLTTPISARGTAASSNTGAPESPVQAPRPGRALRVAGSTRRSCSEPGRPVETSRPARRVPPVRPSPRTATPKPTTVNGSSTLAATRVPSAAGAPAAGAGAAGVASGAAAGRPRGRRVVGA